MVDGDEPVTVYEVQGDLRFAGAETVVRALASSEHATKRVVLDLSRVYRLHDVGHACCSRASCGSARTAWTSSWWILNALRDAASIDPNRHHLVDTLELGLAATAARP